MEQKAPAFIKVDNYKNVMAILQATREKISQAKVLLSKIEDIKKEEDAVIASWASTIDDVEERVGQSDAALLEPEV